MDKKYLIAIGASIAVIIAIALLTRPVINVNGPINNDKQVMLLQQIADTLGLKLGATGSRDLRPTFSSTATTSSTIFATNTATTSFLTIGCTSNVVSSPYNLGDIDTVGVFVQANASSTASKILIKPEVSNNCVDWYEMSSLYYQVTTAGSAVDTFTLTSPGATYLAWTPGVTSLALKNFVLNNLTARAIRFNVSVAAASSTVYMEANAVARITR